MCLCTRLSGPSEKLDGSLDEALRGPSGFFLGRTDTVAMPEVACSDMFVPRTHWPQQARDIFVCIRERVAGKQGSRE